MHVERKQKRKTTQEYSKIIKENAIEIVVIHNDEWYLVGNGYAHAADTVDDDHVPLSQFPLHLKRCRRNRCRDADAGDFVYADLVYGPMVNRHAWNIEIMVRNDRMRI